MRTAPLQQDLRDGPPQAGEGGGRHDDDEARQIELCLASRHLHVGRSAAREATCTCEGGEEVAAHLSRPQAKQKNKRKTGVVDLHMV